MVNSSGLFLWSLLDCGGGGNIRAAIVDGTSLLSQMKKSRTVYAPGTNDAGLFFCNQLRARLKYTLNLIRYYLITIFAV